MFTKIKIAWDYFLYNPEKTDVILHLYFLNPIFKFIETIVFFKINTSRKIILWVKDKAHKIL